MLSLTFVSNPLYIQIKIQKSECYNCLHYFLQGRARNFFMVPPPSLSLYNILLKNTTFLYLNLKSSLWILLAIFK
jgi:hypothetical protein